MHQTIRDRLEDYLEGACSSEAKRALDEHLEKCAACRDEVALMKAQSAMLQDLRLAEKTDPAPGFYARVMNRIEVRRTVSFWNLLLDPVFGRRLVYATLTAVLVMGTYLATTEPVPTTLASAAAEATPEIELARPDASAVIGSDETQDRDAVLVQLATHSE